MKRRAVRKSLTTQQKVELAIAAISVLEYIAGEMLKIFLAG